MSRLSSQKQLPTFWELDSDNKFLIAWLQKRIEAAANLNNITDNAQHQILYNNLVKAVGAMKIEERPITAKEDDDDEEDDDDDDYNREGNSKKSKNNNNKRRKTTVQILHDPYKIWFQGVAAAAGNDNEATAAGTTTTEVVWDDSQDDIPETAGGKIAVLSVGGILNGMSGYIICNSSNPNPKTVFKNAITTGIAEQIAKSIGKGITVLQLHAIASKLHQSIAEQVKTDILRTTPNRIQTLLAPDLTPNEFSSIRKRIYDTVILGRGIHNNSNADNDEDDLPTASNTGAVHDIEKYKKCNICGNNDQAEFVLDRKNGDVICSQCGFVVSESLMHEGSQFRKFEGEEDRNHHGDAANPLYSNAHNMGTSLSGVAPTTGAGIGGFGSASGGGGGGKRNLETILKNAHAYTELNVSQFGKTDRRTRIGYKDRQKKEAFIQMTHAGDALNLHEAVVQRGKELFAGFRDDRELVQQFKGVLAACLCEAFEQLSAEGKHLLKQQQQQYEQQNQTNAKTTTTDNNNSNNNNVKNAVSSRAARRNELHKATLAGKGGLLLNNKDEKVAATVEDTTTAAAAAGNGTNNNNNNEKPAASWDLEDCRTFLLEASRRIAQTWVDERKKNTPIAKKLPQAPLGELEGQLVEHSIKLCEHLEEELQSRSSKQQQQQQQKSAPRQRVITPRVTDMTKLGIKWQHSHERGSGGKGGVGGSGTTTTSQIVNNRTAGQILILKTAKKLGLILNDNIAGEAIHRELRAVIAKQEERKRKEMREEATRQRFNQMQRKPWLQARAQQ